MARTMTFGPDIILPEYHMVLLIHASEQPKNVEKGEKSPERIDVVRLKLYLRRFRIRLYS